MVIIGLHKPSVRAFAQTVAQKLDLRNEYTVLKFFGIFVERYNEKELLVSFRLL